MTYKDHIKKELEEQLERVKQRLQILDMIEEKLFQMRELAQRVVDEDLTDEEIQKINKQVKYLEEQVRLLDSESTQLS
ncbi:hypothetical protein SAMN02745975_00267 [Geosporobacter subterraneus DSM 17957]|uniref:Uncharacterized protein n=1 Tax=Geosporobacter subterraneus DSM 17957 TaxID=1121919 RepID=A0A1M6CN08_9FIRM|nr:hypothetical protein [Geosporobacter subterraneus]SHI62303.1 hypothetical protein SAMN02745975_00267 [Geosporobacter subterraneus DSM 17957]